MIAFRHMAQLGIAALALGLSACATTPRPDVVRFHLGAQIAPGTVYVEPVDPAASQSLEYRIYADEVRDGWRRLGFTPADTRAGTEYVSTIALTSAMRPGGPSRSPVSVGIGGGGGSYGRGGGFGGGGIGISLPLGRRSSNNVALTELTVTLRRRSDSSAVWEGRAAVEAPTSARTGAAPQTVPTLVDALFSDFPGPSGVTTRYRPGA